MANQITVNGIEVDTLNDLIAQFVTDMQGIYGADIAVGPSFPDTPDTQMMMIFLQAVVDLEDLVVQVFNSMDPDLAIGNVLDQRVAYNGIQREAGTYTITPISILVSSDCTLTGLNDDPDNPYAVADEEGNQWFLIDTQNPVASDTPYSYPFRSAVPGAVLTTINTITVPVTVVLGVAEINNPLTYTTLGTNEETDAALRVRRQKSVSLGAQGVNAALEAALNNIPGMGSAKVYENDGSVTDSDGIPGHSIWVVVSGSALDADIANAIYVKRNEGCGMKGDVEYVVTQPDGSPFTVRWSEVVPEDLYIKFTATSLNGTVLPNTAAILAQLPDLYNNEIGVAQEVNINQLATLVQQIDPNTLVTVSAPAEGFSETGVALSYALTLNTSDKAKEFTVQSGNIAITVTPL